jgi:SAM-dependent methyltransferase
MYIVERSRRFMEGLLKSYGPTNIKRLIWNKEFSHGKWDFIDNTAGDCVYAPLEKYARNGSILDLGCGPGNTANELKADAYGTYLGVDISEACLAKAARRTEETGRTAKNRFEQADFISYVPTRKFDVILFRESMYHVPLGKVKATLDRYSKYLNDGGVFVVRIDTSTGDSGKTKYRPKAMVDVMASEFDVVENLQLGKAKTTVIIFRPKSVS